MKWVVVALALTASAEAFNNETAVFSSMSALQESVLEQQRGGFFTADTHYSIGLSMKVMINNRLAFNSNLYGLLNGQANKELIDVTGVSITPVLDAGKVGLILKSSASNIKTNATLDVNIKSPVNYHSYKAQRNVESRIRAATRRLGY
ncbi:MULTISPECIES: hypothetical protein [Oceanimonas]|uniref:Uncharacterized protein n=1 Tax=Oceanimonas doudoroffii TaxID=84158 RepID=A0A233RC24_9GAMM|nr:MULTISPECIES: hypothetical protein [Oceanimonas]NHI01025.1 hypothetical protein [Oceanimonas sp. MB9]OXY80939.1 hypothetical protein B6S08_14515 [Oceanimonas doudoroffii]